MSFVQVAQLALTVIQAACSSLCQIVLSHVSRQIPTGGSVLFPSDSNGEEGEATSNVEMEASDLEVTGKR